MDILKRMNAARSAAVTCSASRHAAQIGAALVLHDGDWRLMNAPRECGESLAATVAALWGARAEVERLRTDLETAERALDAQTDFRAEIERLRAQVAALQARVDALMLEFCPDEMNEEQLENWARHQQPARRDGR